jgi:hypothetical protein
VGVRTRSPARMQRASRSIVSLRLKILSSMRASEISSSLCLHIAIGMKEWKGPEKGQRSTETHIATHRPGSYSVDAIGESSQWIVIIPSNGLCGSGRTIFASTCASTLHTSAVRGTQVVFQVSRVQGVRYRVLPREHSTWPSSAPKESECGRASRNSRPSRRRDWSRAEKKKSFSGIEGDGGRMAVLARAARRL